MPKPGDDSGVESGVESGVSKIAVWHLGICKAHNYPVN